MMTLGKTHHKLPSLRLNLYTMMCEMQLITTSLLLVTMNVIKTNVYVKYNTKVLQLILLQLHLKFCYCQ